MKYRVCRDLTYMLCGQSSEQVVIPAGAEVDVVRVEDLSNKHDRVAFRETIQREKKEGRRTIIFNWKGQARGATLDDDVESIQTETGSLSDRWKT